MKKKEGARDSAEKLLGATTMRERIERRAYELFELRGRGEGLDLQDWLQAEREVQPPRDQSVEFTKQ